jgi:hypothetical protein
LRHQTEFLEYVIHGFPQGACNRFTPPAVDGLVALTGCTTLDVHPVPAAAKLDRVCIKLNDDVSVDDFVPIAQEGLSSHGVALNRLKR